MNKINEKALCFLTALMDVYRDEECRELNAFDGIKLSDDFTEDLTAMLLAMKVIFDRVVGDDIDLIDFTHILNKLAVQNITDGERKDNEIKAD